MKASKEAELREQLRLTESSRVLFWGSEGLKLPTDIYPKLKTVFFPSCVLKTFTKDSVLCFQLFVITITIINSSSS